MPEDNQNTDDPVVSIGRYMMFAMWAGLLALLTLIFYNWQQSEMYPNESASSILNARGQTELILEANRQGQYIVTGSINTTPVVFLVDTGANDVSIPGHIADKIGLRRGMKIIYETANGTAIGYQTKIKTINVGGIKLKNIKASINPNVRFNEVLLGMSFLKHIEMIHKNKTLILRY